MATSDRLKMRTKLAYGVGAAAEAGPYIAFNSFNMLLYNQKLGLSGTLCGLAVTLALVFDAIADPAIGFWSDRLRSKLGRRHPFMYAAPLPLLFAVYMLYSPPSGLSEIPLFIWLTTFTLLFRQALSLYHVPHLALGAEMTTDYHERSVVMSYNAIFGLVGGASAGYFGWSYIQKTSDGTGSLEAFAKLGTVLAVVAALIVFVSTHYTRDQIPKLRAASPDQGPASLKMFFGAMGDCVRNDNYRMLLLGMLFLSATLGVRETLHSYINLFFWELKASDIKNFALASPPAYVIAFIFTVRLHRVLEKRGTVILAMLVVIFAVDTPVPCRLLGIFPENGTRELMRLLLLFHFIFYLGFAMLTISVLSALADIADEHELVTGRRQEGMFYAARTFFAQLSSALGHLLAGIAIDVIAFPTNAKPGTVEHSTLIELGWVEGPLAALPSLVAIYFYMRFRINTQRHAEIQRELSARRSALRAVPASEPAPAMPAAGEVFGSS